jgi:hypothetical protein
MRRASLVVWAGMASGSANQRAVRQHGWLKEEVGGGLVSAASVKD